MTFARINAVRIEHMRAALLVNDCTFDDLTHISGLSKPAVQRWVKSVRSLAPRPIFIGGWGHDVRNREFVPKFRWGYGEDAPRPGTLKDNTAERMRNMRARKKVAKKR